MFDFLYELNDIAALLAAKTIEDLLPGRHAERRRFLLVEGAESEVIQRTLFVEHHIGGNNLNDVICLDYRVYAMS